MPRPLVLPALLLLLSATSASAWRAESMTSFGDPANVDPPRIVKDHPTGQLDSRCDSHTCTRLRLDDGSNGANALDTTPGATGADPLYWGAQRVLVDVDGISSCTSATQDKVVWASAPGRLACATDKDTTYAAGEGLLLEGGGFRLATPTAAALGGVRALACAQGMVLTGIGTDGAAICSAAYALPRSTVPRANAITTLDHDQSMASEPAVSLTLGADGLPVVSYQGGSRHLKVAQCADLSCSAATLATVDAGGTVGLHSSIAIGTDGLPVVAYYDVDNADLKVAKCGNPSCSSANVVTTVDAAGQVGKWPSVVVGADGRPGVAYFDETNGNLKFVRCGNAACTSDNVATTVDGAPAVVGWHVSAAMGLDGRPIIAYTDDTNSDLKVAKCGDPGCASGNVLTRLEDSGRVGYASSIAIGADGRPIIAHVEVVGSTLRLTRCFDDACTSGGSTTIEPGGVVPRHTSVAIGRDGLPVVTFESSPANVLKMVKCLDVSCSGHRGVVLDGGHTGRGSSIALGVDGHLVIAYNEGGTDSLRVAHLANEFGVSGWSRRG